MAFGIPVPTSEFVNPKTGLLNRQWYLFLNNLFGNIGNLTFPASGTSGGILAFTSASTLASSAALTVNRLVLGGGAGTPPTVLGAGTATQVLHGNAGGAPTFSQIATADVSANAITNTLLAQMAANTLKGNNTGGLANAGDLTVSQVLSMLGIGSPITNSLSGDVLLNNVNSYFDGPSIAQGSVGTWFVSGTVTVLDTAAVANFAAKLWDGTTGIDSASIESAGASSRRLISMSGYLASPAGNLRISVKSDQVNSKIVFNQSGNTKDSTITAFRIA